MTQLFKGIALLVGLTSFVWLAVLWHWQSTQRDMSVQDIAVYLVALPLTVFVLALLARWAWSGVSSAAPGAPSVSAAPADDKSAAVLTAEDRERLMNVQLIGAGVCTVAGVGVEALVAACKAGQPRPTIDPQLRDADGLPVMTARVPDLDVDGLGLQSIESALQALCPGWIAAAWPDEHQRALAGLQAALDDVLAQWPAPPVADAPEAGRGTQEGPVLRILSSWPRHWSEDDVAVGTRWLESRLDQAAPAWSLRRTPTPQAHGVDAWTGAERGLRSAEREGRQEWILVTACHSSIGPASIDRLERAGRLYSARTPKQPIPGEAAAVLLLAPPSYGLAGAQADDRSANAPALLHRGVAVRKEREPKGGRAGSAATQDCIVQALSTGPFPSIEIGAAVHDADQHTPRAAEALVALMNELPHLAPADDTLQIGALTGQTGVAAPLLAIALAAHEARVHEKPCLALSLDDDLTRFALIARPAQHQPGSSLELPDPAGG